MNIALLTLAAPPEQSNMEILMAGLYLMLVGAVFIWGLLIIIAMWRLFKKAGEPGFKVLIPVVNIYTYYKIAWTPLIFWVEVVFIVVRLVFTTLAPHLPKIIRTLAGGAMAIPLIVILVLTIVLALLTMFKFCKSYGKGLLFFLGLLFMFPVFILVLGFGKSEYLGPGGSEKEDDE